MTIRDNIAHVRDRIEQACRRCGRDPHSVRLLPVSKVHPTSAILEAYKCGVTHFGENRVQEVVAKSSELPPESGITFAVIGHLQTNKAGKVVQYATEFQALDSMRIAEALERRCQQASKGLDVMIEVNSSGEESKFGLPPEQVVDFARRLSSFDALNPIGLMTVAAYSSDRDRVGRCFNIMKDVQRALRDEGIGGHSWDELSMGMTNDYEMAIEYGSTCIRVGTAIFGKRAYDIFH